MKFNFFGKKKEEQKRTEPVSEYSRSYSAAKASNLNYGWGRNTTTEDNDIYQSLEALRARSRSLSQNNPIFKHYLMLLDNNVVGKDGFKLQVLGKDNKNVLDLDGNAAVERSFRDWTKSQNCDITEKKNFNQICSLIVKSVAKDGEALIRFVAGSASKDNKYGFKLQVLNIDRLDVKYNADLNNGNYIRMGVEIDHFGRPVAYHLKKFSNKAIDWASGTYETEFERIPATEMLHIFLSENAEQTRGVPWAHAVILSLKDFDEFDEACLNAGKIGASSSIYLERASGVSTNQIADFQHENGEFISEIGMGEIRSLPQGTTFKSFEAKYPSDAYQIYTKRLLQKIAGGLGLSQIFLGNDTEDLNYSTARTIIVEERSYYATLQHFIIENVLNKVYEKFLQQALLNKMIKKDTFNNMPIEEMYKFLDYKFIGRSWEWVDPLKEIQATLLEYKNGMKPLSTILNEKSLNLAEVMLQYKRDSEIIKANLGIDLDWTQFFQGMLGQVITETPQKETI